MWVVLCGMDVNASLDSAGEERRGDCDEGSDWMSNHGMVVRSQM